MDELDFDGIRHIAVKRAARESGYTADYLGQLIRGGKLVGRKVGRSWYVDETSLKTYLAQSDEKIHSEESSVSVTPNVSVPEVSPVKEESNDVEVRVVRDEPVSLKKEVVGAVRGVAKKVVSPEYSLLTYVKDEEPMLPHLSGEPAPKVEIEPQPETEEVVEAAATPETPPAFYEKLITEDIPKRHRGERRSLLPAPSALLAGLALALLLTSGSVALISERLSYVGGVTTSSYAIEYGDIDFTETVASAFVGVMELRLTE